MKKEEVRDQFAKDVQEIAKKLIDAFGLVHAQSNSTSLDEPLIRWLDFRLRYIEPKARLIACSNRFPVQVPSEIESALLSMERRILQGEDLNPYQSKTIAKNDTSGVKRQQRTDGLWADWGIHHLHLAEVPATPGERFSVRSGWLLFVRVYEDAIVLVDVRDHNEANLWTQEDLVKTFIESWPDQAKQFELKGVLADGGAQTSDQIAALRKAGVNRFITHGGVSYMGMGQGITTAATSTKVTLESDKIRRNARNVADWAADAQGPIATALVQLGVTQPKLSLSLHSQGLIVFEETSQSAWLLDRKTDMATGALHEVLLPSWAVGPLVQHWSANP